MSDPNIIQDADIDEIIRQEEKIIPTCCWCGSPLRLNKRLAWCTGKQECRDRQMACGVSMEIDGVIKWLFLPTPKQAECMEADDPNLFIWGNRGGGKSVAIRWLCHQLAIAVPGFRYAILRTSFPELFKNHISFLENEMEMLGGERAGFRFNKTEHTCYYPHGSMGFYAQCATDADVKKILGVEIALVVFDEAPTFNWGHMRLIAASVRVPEGSGLIPMTRYLGNPIGESIDELWRYFIDKDVSPKDDSEYRPQDWKAIEIRIQDNPHLNAKTYWRQFAGLPKHWIKAWKDGVRMDEDALFEFWPTKDGVPYHVVREIPKLADGKPLFRVDSEGRYHFPEWVRIYRSYDHGFHPDPAVCLWFAVFGRRILAFKELTRYRKLASKIAEEIRAESKGMHVSATYCDPSIGVEEGIENVKQKIEGAGVPMDDAVNDREIFADTIHTLLGEEVAPGIPRIQFLEGAMGMTIKALPRMKYSEKNPAAMADHKLDHWPVAVAYFGMSNIPAAAPGRPTGKLRRWQIPKSKQKGSSMARMMARKFAREDRA